MSEVQATETVVTEVPALIQDIIAERNDIVETFRTSDQSEEAAILAVDAAISETLRIVEGPTGLVVGEDTLTDLAESFFNQINS